MENTKMVATPFDQMHLDGQAARDAGFGEQPMDANDIAQAQRAADAALAEEAEAARLAALPPLAQQLDAIWQGLAAYHDGQPLPDATVAMLNQIQAAAPVVQPEPVSETDAPAT